MIRRDRVWATVAVWAAFTITTTVIVAQVTSRLGDLTLLALVALIGLAAVAGTFAVWHGWRQDESRSAAKAKRSAHRLARLAEQPHAVDAEDEIDHEARLLAWHGESAREREPSRRR